MDAAGPIDALEESPLFNLSLSSKELFHSNFLAWLFESYPSEFGRALSKFTKNSRSGTGIKGKVLRELKNRDLTIEFENEQWLIIENKVKSLPYIEQLTEYSLGAKPKQNFLLLSLVPPPFARNGLIDAGTATWRAITYAELADLLEQSKNAVTNPYHALLLDDYITFIRAMHDIFSSNSIGLDEPFSAVLSREGNATLRRLQSIRIGDVYQKLRCEALAVMLHERLLKTYPGHAHIGVPAEKRIVDDIYIGYGMTNSNGLIEASLVIAPGLFLTVQIQGLSYRKMVAGYAGYQGNSRDIAQRLREKKLWFDFSNIGKGLGEYPRGDKGFNGYSNVDFYRSVTIPDDTTVGNVLGAVVSDIKGAIERRALIAAA